LTLTTGLLVGCASTRPTSPAALGANETAFTKVVRLDLRVDSMDDFARLTRPGDLIVTYMRLGRVVKTRQWLFALLPHGHAIIVLEARDPRGLLEARFRGIRRVSTDDLRMYSYFDVYRLRNHERLNVDRLVAFADHGSAVCHHYSFKSWLTLNDNLRPDNLADVSQRYTCSTAALAAYHFAGVTLRVDASDHAVITPLSVAASMGRFNGWALAPEQSDPQFTATPSADSALLGVDPETVGNSVPLQCSPP
jgi:hypothetical protein